MRRSNSSSCIPMPKKNLFDVRQSQAGSRLNQDGSSKRSQSTSRLSRQSDGLANRPGSLLKTPLSGMRTSRLGFKSPRSGASAQKTILKLSGDKKWVAQQYAKVQDFITTSQLFDSSIVTADNIKPPTINVFIYVASTLLQELFPSLQMNSTNYKEVLLLRLKQLKYPGNLTNSFLKTVNTMHAWPQVMGLFSWLIDKVNLTRYAKQDKIVDDDMDPQTKQNRAMRKTCWEFLMQKYTFFNNSNKFEEDPQLLKDNYVKSMSQILDVSDNQLQSLKTFLKKAEIQETELKDEVQILSKKCQTVKSNTDVKLEQISLMVENDDVTEYNLNKEIEHLKTKLHKLKSKKQALTSNIKSLEDAIKIQPCSYEEKKKLVDEINELKIEESLKKKKILHAEAIKYDIDHKLADKISQIRKICENWNLSLMELCFNMPEIKDLLLRDKGFHAPEFSTEIQNVIQSKIAIEEHIAKSLKKVEADITKQQRKMHDIKLEGNELTKTVEQLKEKIKASLELKDKLNKEIEQNKSELKTKEKLLREWTKLGEDFQKQIKDQDDLIKELEKEKLQREDEVKKYALKMLSFSVEVHKQVIDKLTKMDEITETSWNKLEEKVYGEWSSDLAEVKEVHLMLESDNKKKE